MLLSTLTDSDNSAKGLLGPERRFQVASVEVAQTATERLGRWEQRWIQTELKSNQS